MAALTWRNVDAPDFSGAMEGYKNFANLIDRAFSGLDRGIARFDQAQTDNVNNRVMNELLKIQDPEALQAAIQSGQFDDPRLNAASRSTIMARTPQLLEQAEGFRRKGQAEASDLLTPEVLRAVTLAQSGNEADIAEGTKLLANNPLVAKVGLNKALEVFSSIQNAGRTGLDMSNTRQDMDFAGLREGRDAQMHGFTVEDRNLQKEADTIVGELWGYEDQADAQERLRQLAGSNPRLYGIVAKQMQWGGPKDYSSITGSEGGSTAGGGQASGNEAAARIMNYEARAAGFGSVPASVKTLGQASDFARQVNKAGVASSAMGVYQIVGSTLRSYAPEVLGPNWQKEAYSVENQDKIARAIFEDNRGSAAALQKQWVSLSRADAERVRKMPWEQARNEISSRESSSQASALLGAAMGDAGTQSDRQTSRAAATQEITNQVPLAKIFSESIGDKGSNNVRAVAVQLSKENPGISADALEAAILREQSELRNVGAKGGGARSSLNATMIGKLIIENHGSRTAREGFWGNLLRDPIFGSGNELGGGLVYDKTKVRTQASDYVNGNLDDALSYLGAQGTASAAEGNLTAKLNVARARLEAKQQAAQAGKKVNLTKELLLVQNLEAQLQGVQSTIDDPASALRADPSRPAPPPKKKATTPKAAPPRKPMTKKELESAWDRAIRTMPPPEPEVPFYLRRR